MIFPTVGVKELKKKKFVYHLHTKRFKAKDGFHFYFKLLHGVWNYIFDDIARKEKEVLVQVDKSTFFIMTMKEFLMHLIMWRPNVVFSVPVDRTDMYDTLHFTNKTMTSLMERICKKFIDLYDIATPALSESISHIIENWTRLAEAFSSAQCNTVSLYDVIQFKNRNREFAALVTTELDESKPMKELENYIKTAEKLLVASIEADKKNCLYPYVESARIDRTQLTQMFVAVGPRPDIDKTILPKPIKRGYVHGLQDVGEFFVEAVTCRDALLTKLNSVPLSGYLSRRINILCLGTTLDYGVTDCGTPNTLAYTVYTPNHLRMIEGKYMVTDAGKLKVISNEDTDLVGKTIKLRSHICCALDKGDGRVCKTCYGTAYKTLYGTRIGGLPSVKFANPMSQKAMSAKHKTSTNAIEVRNETLHKYFEIDGSQLFIRDQFAEDKTLFICFDKDDLEEIMNNDIDVEDTSIDITFPLQSVTIKHGQEEFVIENEGMLLTLAEDILSDTKLFVKDDDNPDRMLLPFKKIDKDAPVFSLILITEEISRFLSLVMLSLDGSKTKKFATYDELVDDVMKVVNDSGIFVKLPHIETIIHNMVRDVKDVTRRPAFEFASPPYTMLTISNAIIKKDQYTSLIFQSLKRQFKDINSFNKTGTGVFDRFFKVSHPYREHA